MRFFNIQKLLDLVLITLLILSTGGLLFVFNRNICYGVFIFLLIATISLGLKFKKMLFNSYLTSYFLLLSFLALNYFYAVSVQSLNKYGFYLMVITVSTLFLFHFLNNRNYETLVRRVYLVLKIIMVHALFNFLAFFFIQENLTAIIGTHHECQTFYNIFFYGSELKEFKLVRILGVEFCRNQGLFWEPGVLQVFLNIFFFLEAFILKKNRKLLILTSFILLTTYSTTGIALLIIQVFIFILREFKRNQLIFSILLFISFPVFIIFNINMQEKLSGEKQASYMKRIYDFAQPMYIAFQNPLTGVGLDIERFQELRSEFYFSSDDIKTLGIDYKYDERNQKNTNSLTFLFAAMGFPTAIFFLYMFIKQNIFLKDRWIFLLIMLVSALSEPLLFRPFFFIFIISGLTYTFYKIIAHRNS